MRQFHLFILLFLFSINLSFSQIDKAIPMNHYAQMVETLTTEKLIQKGVMDADKKISKVYCDKKNERQLNEKGFDVYFETRTAVEDSVFKDYLFLQSIHFEDAVYVLYFSVEDRDDFVFQILKWNKNDWDRSDKIAKTVLQQSSEKFEKIVFNNDKGAKNVQNVHIFIKNDYLVLERSGLFYALYDLKAHQLLINEENPWKATADDGAESIDTWVRENLHEKIEAIINQ